MLCDHLRLRCPRTRRCIDARSGTFDGHSSLAWVQEWRICHAHHLRRNPRHALCLRRTAPQQPFDGQQPSGSASDVVLRAGPETIAAGGSMTLTLDNESAGTIGDNLCASGLERGSGVGWQPVPENRLCTMELRTLQPSDEISEEIASPRDARVGRLPLYDDRGADRNSRARRDCQQPVSRHRLAMII